MADSHEHPSYVKVWAILLMLLVISILGPMLGVSLLTLITAFGIAVVKAHLVAKNFMHLNVERKYVAYMLVTALAFVLLFYAGTSPDVMEHHGRNWTNVSAKEEVRRALDEAAAAGETSP